MSAKKFLRKNSTLPKSSSPETISEIAIAATISSQNENKVHDFISFITKALERNYVLVNNLVQKNPSFKCAILKGSGPDCFKVKHIVYPLDEELNLEIELMNSEDHDKIGVAALVRITGIELNSFLDYIKYKLRESVVLQKDLVEGKNLGVSFLVLQHFADGQFKVTERLAIDSSSSLIRKRKKNSELIISSIKKIRKVI